MSNLSQWYARPEAQIFSGMCQFSHNQLAITSTHSKDLHDGKTKYNASITNPILYLQCEICFAHVRQLKPMTHNQFFSANYFYWPRVTNR